VHLLVKKISFNNETVLKYLEEIKGCARNVIPLIVYVTYFYYYKNIWHLVQN